MPDPQEPAVIVWTEGFADSRPSGLRRVVDTLIGLAILALAFVVVAGLAALGLLLVFVFGAAYAVYMAYHRIAGRLMDPRRGVRVIRRPPD